MANWDKLNKEFDQLMGSMTPEAWERWSANRVARKAMRRSELEMKAKLQLEKIFFSNIEGCQILDSLPVFVGDSNNTTIFVEETPVVAGENNYALAA